MAREKNTTKHALNADIKVHRTTLIDAYGENRGVVDTKDALKEAYELGLDLVEMSDNPKQPVCRIMDYGKYLFDLKKRRKIQPNPKNEFKEIRLRPSIGVHDLETKAKQARKFLEEGKKVKIDVRLRGRERQHPELVREVINLFYKQVGSEFKMEEKGNQFLLLPN